ncbi:uncharacterized protein BDZ83DRAFT_639455 [Colletotrichum acutatum]|uniref:Uncharacterized protein n=1 Tax=Glomerella acutata TaxID=27357 RepID=A0AAD8UEB8_GLOAC|nr:uncharacterized protein BDZ83DRAFT_639455 [Colletotrichum acutatum]KAK1711612.1 hypothetical protein BDZ83DRAFT_639455 [Colletotrichum acutatum]
MTGPKLPAGRLLVPFNVKRLAVYGFRLQSWHAGLSANSLPVPTCTLLSLQQ